MSAELIREYDTFWAQIVKQFFKPLVKIQQYTELNGSPKLQPSHKQTKNQNKNLKQSWLPAFWKKIQNTQEIKRTLFDKTKQDKTCTFSM